MLSNEQQHQIAKLAASSLTVKQPMEGSSSQRRRSISRSFKVNKKQISLDEEMMKLKELLQQSLRREADALEKVKHLQEMYKNLLYRQEGSPQPNGETTGFPQLVVVADNSMAMQETEKEREITNKTTAATYNGNSLLGKQQSPTITSTLAPIPVTLRGVKYEREKPPNLSESLILSKSPSPTESIPAKLPLQPSHSDESIEKRNEDYIKKKKISESLSLRRQEVQNKYDVELRSENKAAIRNARSGSFWKRKSRNNPESTESFDALFNHFTRSSTYRTVHPLKKYLMQHWSEVCGEKQQASDEEIKYRNAVWELFLAETKYLTKQLLPLEQVYKGFLEELHFHGLLREAKIEKIFANISELCELTSSVAYDLLRLFERRSSVNIAQPNELILSFNMFGHKFNPIYKQFCTNYEQQRGYIKSLEKQPNFQEYLRVCRTAPAVQKSDLQDLLITPIQHQFHYQLLLDKVLKYTSDPNHRAVLHSTIKAFTVSLKELEAAITQQKCSLELLELSEMIYWPPLTTGDTYIPQSLVDRVTEQPCSHTLLKSSGRYLQKQSAFKMLDIRGRPYTDVQLILLNDLLLIAEIKGPGAKKVYPPYSLIHQPLQLNCLQVHLPPDSPRPLFSLLHQSPLGQQLACITLLATSNRLRQDWINELCTLGVTQI